MTNFSLKPRSCMLALIRLYQIIVSPLLPPSCRFVPTCSTYAFLAINRYGILKGGSLTVMRLLKCHPFHVGGYDPLK